MQKCVNLVDPVKSFATNIFLQNVASIQKGTSPVKFAHLAEKSGKSSISNLSTKVDVGALVGDLRGFLAADPRSARGFPARADIAIGSALANAPPDTFAGLRIECKHKGCLTVKFVN